MKHDYHTSGDANLTFFLTGLWLLIILATLAGSHKKILDELRQMQHPECVVGADQ